MGILEDIRVSRAPALGLASMGMVWAAFAALVPELKAQIGAGDAAFGASFLISSLGALGAMWLAPLADRRFGALSILAAMVALPVLFLIPAGSGGLILFTMGMLLTAATSGIGDILMSARIAEIEAVRRRPLMNLNHGIYSFSYAGTAVLTGLAREAGWSPLQIFAVIGVVIAAISPLMRAPHQRVAGETSILPRKGAQVLVWMAGLVFLVGFLTEQAVEGWSALHVERTLGGRPAEGALGPAILGLTMGFGRLFGQLLAARISDTLMIALACVMSAFGVSLAALAPSIPVAYLGFGIMGLGISVVVPLSISLVGRVVPQDQRVAAIGRASVIGYGAFLVGPSLMGVTSDLFGLRAAFLLIGILLMLVAAVVVPMISRRIMTDRFSGVRPLP